MNEGDLTRAVRAMAFATAEAIKAGLLDDLLLTLRASISERERLYDPASAPPMTREMATADQVWVWMAALGRWEIRGAGMVR